MTKEELINQYRSVITSEQTLYAIGLAYEVGALAERDKFKAMLGKHTKFEAVVGHKAESFVKGFNTALEEIREGYERL